VGTRKNGANMGRLQELESENWRIREEIEKAYRQMTCLNKIIVLYPETNFTRQSLREQSLLEKILPTNETST
jgi:hypothetical protein